MAAVFANCETQRFAVLRQISGVNHQVHLRHLFIAAPYSNLVVDQINSRAAVTDFVGADHFLQIHADFGAAVWERNAGDRGIFFQPAPVTLVAECLAFYDSDRSKESPAANDSGLSWGQSCLLDGQELVIMKNVAMDQVSSSMVL